VHELAYKTLHSLRTTHLIRLAVMSWPNANLHAHAQPHSQTSCDDPALLSKPTSTRNSHPIGTAVMLAHWSKPTPTRTTLSHWGLVDDSFAKRRTKNAQRH
jgi:hypothetical protein